MGNKEIVRYNFTRVLEEDATQEVRNPTMDQPLIGTREPSQITLLIGHTGKWFNSYPSRGIQNV